MRRMSVCRAFTVVELLVVVAVIGVLVGLLVPVMRSVNESSGETQCANNLRQLGAAAAAYLATYKDYLPQMAGPDPMTGEQKIIGTLFGGKRGQLPMFGIDQFGAEERPLNSYLGKGSFLIDDDPSDGIQEDMPMFECPLDRGQPAQPPFLPQVDSMYDFVGTSYILNDHTLDGEDYWTLVPARTGGVSGDPTQPGRPGGKMPPVADPTKTWMIGDHPIYNYQQGGDRQQRWHHNKVRCNLCFVDGHVGSGIEVPPCTDQVACPGGLSWYEENTTKFYTFFPSPDWVCRRFDNPPGGP